MKKRRTTIKITLNGSLVYYNGFCASNQAVQDAIMDIDFMVPTERRLYLANVILCLPDETVIHLGGQRPPYLLNMQSSTLCGQHVAIQQVD